MFLENVSSKFMLLHEKKFHLLCHDTGKCDLLINLPCMSQ